MKCRLKHFKITHILEFIFYYDLGMERPTDQEMTTIEKILCYTHRL